MQLDAKNGVITRTKAFSDSMDWTLPEAIEKALLGCRFDTVEMQVAIRNTHLDGQVQEDLCRLLAEQVL